MDVQRQKRFIATGFAALIAATVIYGFWIVGSPQTNRERVLDKTNIERVRRIYEELQRNYCDKKKSLPENLDNISVPSYSYEKYYITKEDAHTEQPFAYKKLGDNSFEICATFSQPRIGDAWPCNEKFMEKFCDYQPGLHCAAMEMRDCAKDSR